jgi:hypothetical protein
MKHNSANSLAATLSRFQHSLKHVCARCVEICIVILRVNSKLRNETQRDKTTVDTAVQRFSVIAKLLENRSALVSAPPLAPAEL